MKTAIIISDSALKLQAIADLAKAIGRVDMQSRRRIVVEGDFGLFAINLDESIMGDFDSAEAEKIAAYLTNPQCFLLEFSSPSAADAAVRVLPRHCQILIDNDHGLLVDRLDVLARISRGEDWTEIK